MAQAAVVQPVAATQTPPGLWRMVVLLGAAYAMASASQFVVVVLTPGVKATLGASDTSVSLLNGAAFALPHALAILVFGPLADRFNRRNLLMAGLLGWSLALIAGGLSQTFPQLIAARVALGAFQGVLSPAALSMVADEAPPRVRGRAMTLMMSGGAIGGTLSLFIGGALLQLFSGLPPVHLPLGLILPPWQSVLVVVGLPGVLLTPLLLTIREPERHAAPEGDSFRLFAYLKANAAVFVPFLLCCGLFTIGGYAQASWGAVVLLRNQHMPPAEAGLALGVMSLAGSIIAAPLGGWLSDAFVRRDPLAGRLKLLIIILPLAAIAVTFFLAEAYPPLVFSTFFLAAIGGTLTAALAATILPELTPSEGRGRVAAVFGLISIVFGMGFAPTMVALVTDKVLRNEAQLPAALVLVAAPSFLLATVLAILVLPRLAALRARIATLTGED